MRKAKKQTRPPPDDPAQSERFVKAATVLMADEGGLLFERAMQLIAKPGRLPVKPDTLIIQRPKVGKKKPAGAVE